LAQEIKRRQSTITSFHKAASATRVSGYENRLP